MRILEPLRSITTSEREYYCDTTRMLGNPGGEIIHATLDDNPTIMASVVLRDILLSVDIHL